MPSLSLSQYDSFDPHTYVSLLSESEATEHSVLLSLLRDQTRISDETPVVTYLATHYPGVKLAHPS